jgi:pyridoxine/pyridoxamine 5'-phosphate oxidase
MLSAMNDAEKLLKHARDEMERAKTDGPKPVRWGGYVVHAMGNRFWLTPAGNSEEQSETRN